MRRRTLSRLRSKSSKTIWPIRDSFSVSPRKKMMLQFKSEMDSRKCPPLSSKTNSSKAKSQTDHITCSSNIQIVREKSGRMIRWSSSKITLILWAINHLKLTRVDSLMTNRWLLGRLNSSQVMLVLRISFWFTAWNTSESKSLISSSLKMSHFCNKLHQYSKIRVPYIPSSNHLRQLLFSRTQPHLFTKQPQCRLSITLARMESLTRLHWCGRMLARIEKIWT